MRRLRYILLISLSLVAFICAVVLLNVTAANPTRRRYSSESPLVSGQGNPKQIGLAGEHILARDLGLPRNDASDQLQCICSNAPNIPPRGDCRVCRVSVPLLAASYRRPDFFAGNFIAESKNVQNLLYEGRESDQIEDYARAAKAMNIPLWVFTRVNTNVDAEFVRIVESTGGGVVQYFTVPGYIDPVDQAARPGLIGALLIFGCVSWLEIRSRHNHESQIPSAPPSGGPKRAKDPLGKATDSVEALNRYTRKRKEDTKRQID